VVSKKTAEQYSEAETAARRDAVLKHMLNTPPKPHSEMKIGKASGKKKKSLKQKNRTKDTGA
jgi:hypothetical protein